MRSTSHPLITAQKLITGLLVSSFGSIVSPALATDADVTLNMAWQAGTQSVHRWKMELMLGDDINMQDYGLEGGFRQTISTHKDGLLITRDNVEVSTADYNISGVAPSLPQMMMLKATALMMFSAPDHVVTPDGRLIGLENVEAFKSSQLQKIDQLFVAAGHTGDDTAFLRPMMEPMVSDMNAYREQITQELSLWSALDGLALSSGKPVKTALPVSVGMDARADDQPGISGELQFHGDVACSNNSNHKKCADLRFNGSSADGFEGRPMQMQVDILAEPSTLVPHQITYRGEMGVTGSIQMQHVITYQQ